MYDPTTARFLSKDPLEEQGGSPNLYLYCANDPVNKIDPSGLEPMVPAWFKKLSQKEGGKRIVTWKTWYTTFGKSEEVALLWDWLGGSREDIVTEEQILKIIRDDPEHNPDAQIAVYTAEGAFRRGPTDISEYLVQFKLNLQKYGQHPKIVAEDYEKRKRIFWVLKELDEQEQEPTGGTTPPTKAAPMAPEADGGRAAGNPTVGPQTVPDISKVKPYQFDYHYSTPVFVKVAKPNPLIPVEAAKDADAELIWTGNSAFMTAEGAENAKYLATVMLFISKRYGDIQLRVKDVRARYPKETKELEEIYRTMTFGYHGREPRAGKLVAIAGGRAWPQQCGADCTPFWSTYMFSDEVEKLGERAYYLLRKMTGQVLDKPVKDMTQRERLATIWGLAVMSGRLNAAFAQKIESILTNPALYIGALAYGASHLIGVGEVVDVGLLGLLLVKLGYDAVKIAGKLAVIGDTIKNGKTDIDMDFAAQEFIDISLTAAEDVVAAAPAGQLLRSFKSLREELAAAKAGASGPATGGQPAASGAVGGSRPPASDNYIIPSSIAQRPQPGAVGGAEPPLAAFRDTRTPVPAKEVEIPLPGRTASPDIPCRPTTNTISPPPVTPSPLPVVIPGTITGTKPTPKPEPKPEPEPKPPPQPATATTTEEDQDPCKTLTGFAARGGADPLQSKYATIVQSVNHVTGKREQEQLTLLKERNDGQNRVRIPTDVYFRIDPRRKNQYPLPGGEADTNTPEVRAYIFVVGRPQIRSQENILLANQDTAAHVINADFGGKITLGWLSGKSKDTNIVPVGKLTNDWWKPAGDTAIKNAIKNGQISCAHIHFEYSVVFSISSIPFAPFVPAIPVILNFFPARPTSIRYELYHRKPGNWDKAASWEHKISFTQNMTNKPENPGEGK